MKRLLFFVGIGLATFLSSCSSMYIPSSGNTPLLSEKGEIQGETSITTNSIQNSVNYAFTEHIAGMANLNFSYGNFSNRYDIYTSKDKDSSAIADLTNYGKFNNRYYELGVGYFNIFNSEKFKTEAFIGTGFCHAKDQDDSKKNSKQTYDSKHILTFAQINAGFTFKYCDLGLGFRFAPTFHNFDWESTKDGEPRTSGTEKFTMFHLEPIGFLRVGSDKVRFVGKIGFSYPIYTDSYHKAEQNSCNANYINSTLFHFSMGVNLRLNQKTINN